MAQNTVSIREAANQLGISLHHAYELVWSGHLAARREDGKWRVPLKAVRERLGRKRKVRT